MKIFIFNLILAFLYSNVVYEVDTRARSNMNKPCSSLFQNAVQRIFLSALTYNSTELTKRSDYYFKHRERLIWMCSSEFRFIDLGSGYYPRYIRSVYCAQTSCWLAHSICKPHVYNVKILKRRASGSSVDSCSQHQDQWLPEQLRHSWVFENIPVNIFCECVTIK